MKRVYGWLVLAFLGTLLSACGDFSIMNPMGAPTLRVQVLSQNEEPGDPESGIPSTYIVELGFYTLPGSPGGQVVSLIMSKSRYNVNNGPILPACPGDAAEPCGPAKLTIKYTPIPPERFQLVKVRVKAHTGAETVYTLKTPLDVR